jgi:glycosyltransferase involved in cell wall biosynthesis
VEEELARRARQYLGDDLAFCVYDRYRNLFLTVDDGTAGQFLDGTVQIKIQPPAGDSVSARAVHRLKAARSGLQRAVMASPAVYHALQRLRGRSFTRAEILHVSSQEREKASVLSRLEPARLDSNTVVISGGLDWDFKDLRGIWALKQSHQFRYYPIVYDLIPILFPHYVVPGYVERFIEYFNELYWLADRVMCISETTRRDWLRFCDDVGAEAVPADVFPLGSDLGAGADEDVAPELPAELAGKRYVLFVSTIEPRKNHRLLYEAWDDCIRRDLIDPERDRLVFIGRRGWAVDDLLRELPLNPATRDTILLLDKVDDAQLNVAYRHCAFVVFPSRYEGYGLSVAEALGHGKPCISSTSGALAEIGGDLVVRLDAKDTPAWTRTLAHYLTSPDELNAWSERVEREYKPVTWDMAAESFFTTVVATAR